MGNMIKRLMIVICFIVTIPLFLLCIILEFHWLILKYIFTGENLIKDDKSIVADKYFDLFGIK